MHADEPLPLDDPRWSSPMVDVVARLRPHVGSLSLTEHELTEVLVTGRLHCLNRYQTRGGVWERKLVSFLCWSGRELCSWSNGKFTVRRRQNRSCPKSWSDPRLSYHLFERGVGFNQPGFLDGVLFPWQPDLERLWPAIFAPATKLELAAVTQKPAKRARPKPSKPKPKRKRRAPQVELAGELIDITFSQDEWQGLAPAAIRHKCELDQQVLKKLSKEKKSLPSKESFARAMGVRD